MKYLKLLLCVFVIGLNGCEKSNNDGSSATKLKSGSSSGPSVAEVSTPVTFEFNNPTFDAPVMLMAGGEPMKAGYSYPSPAVFDVDNDGDNEMVLGEIMGTVSYCENENNSSGDPVWSKVAPLLAADGEPLKLNNW